MIRTNYEYIVLGCGGLGSCAIYWLARQAGREVLGLEQFRLGHPHGGSQDHSRIIRLSYDKDIYTRLAPHSYTTWAVLEEESAVRVVTKTGGVQMTPQGHRHRRPLDDYTRSMDAACVPYEVLDADEVMRRWPQFRLTEEVHALYQAETGIANPNKGNPAHVAMARHYGATVLDRCRVLAIHHFAGGVEVDTERGRFTCRRLVITAGAWTDQVLACLGVNLGLPVTQEQVTYYATPNLRDFAIGNFPIFMWDGAAWIYGFPVYGEVATKVAIDAGGAVVRAAPAPTSPTKPTNALLKNG